MISLRVRLSAAGILSVMLLTVATPLFANGVGHPTCLPKQHDCGKGAQLKSCCCLAQGNHSDDATPAGKTPIAQSVVNAALVAVSPSLAPLERPRDVRSDAIPPRSAPHDLITLFGVFLL